MTSPIFTVTGIKYASQIFLLHKKFCELELANLERQIQNIDNQIRHHLVESQIEPDLEWPLSKNIFYL